MNVTLSDYSYVRVASVTPEIRIADVPFNSTSVVTLFKETVNKGAQIVVFPELCISGYTCGDLFYEQHLQQSVEKALVEIAKETFNNGVMIVGAPIRVKGELYNCGVVMANGVIQGVIPKTYLPNYNEFYEMRWFASALNLVDSHIQLCGSKYPFGTDILFTSTINDLQVTIGVEICEDLWAANAPSVAMCLGGAQIICNLSASNELLGKAEYRKDLVRVHSARSITGYVYASAGIGESTTDVVFAGHNIIAEVGSIVAESKRFALSSEYIIADIDIGKINNERIRNSTFRSEAQTTTFREISVSVQDVKTEELYRKVNPTPFIPSSSEDKINRSLEVTNIQTTGLIQRLRHTYCTNVVIGISGGLDSTLALLACVYSFKRLGYDCNGIHCITMPGFGTSDRTKTNAEKLCEALGVTLLTIPITNAVTQHFTDIGHDANNHSIVYENAQARERTQILMDYANKVNGIVIGTGDLSEMALGWSTYNGDHMSMYSVNCGIPKTLIKYLVEWYAESEYNGEVSAILQDICNTPISPELLPKNTEGEVVQQTEKSVGPYVLHDFFLYQMLRFHYPPKKIFLLATHAFEGEFTPQEITHWLQTFYKRFFTQQFKRSCVPDGPKVGSISLSPRGDWRMPSDATARIWLDELENL
ncbi:MAG: NAD(+) synthase [Bacteriodetes bacterium]|nr:NAD(+) synthase [Bacteroidota bacterium]